MLWKVMNKLGPGVGAGLWGDQWALSEEERRQVRSRKLRFEQ